MIQKVKNKVHSFRVYFTQSLKQSLLKQTNAWHGFCLQTVVFSWESIQSPCILYVATLKGAKLFEWVYSKTYVEWKVARCSSDAGIYSANKALIVIVGLTMAFLFAYTLEPDKCRPNPCHNGGSCTELLFDYECTCPHGYHGKHCEGTKVTHEEKACYPLA